MDVCMDYEHTKMRELNIVKEGAEAKQAYLVDGAKHVGDGVSWHWLQTFHFLIRRSTALIVILLVKYYLLMKLDVILSIYFCCAVTLLLCLL